MENNKEMRRLRDHAPLLVCFVLWGVMASHARLVTTHPRVKANAPLGNNVAWSCGLDTLSGPISYDITPKEYLSKSKYTTSVGTPSATFEVNALGAAVYSVDIETPSGGALAPHVSLTYNSQGDYGLAGYGFNITGISSITRMPSTLGQDGEIKGIRLMEGDNYCLDGKRLVRTSGKAGCDGATYSPLGNPHVKVTLHGLDPTTPCGLR